MRQTGFIHIQNSIDQIKLIQQNKRFQMQLQMFQLNPYYIILQ